MVYPLLDYNLQSKYEEFRKRYEELKDLSTFTNSRRKLTFKQNKILQFTADRGSISAYELSKSFPYLKKSIEYKNAKKDLRRLRDLKLLEHDYKGKAAADHSKQKTGVKQFYKLSKYGVYNIITSNENMLFGIVKNLVLNYSNHLLFEIFLFPYIEIETLSKNIDSNIFSEIFLYLHKCCKQVEDMVRSINYTANVKDGYLTDQLFIWENIPREEYDTESLRSFLKQKFNWVWVEKAEIRKTENMKGITISSGSMTALISIDKDNRKAVLSHRGLRKYGFVVRELADDQFAVDAVVDERLEDWYMKTFVIYHIAAYMTKFIISLVPFYGMDLVTPTLKILGQDKRFTSTLNRIKNQFDRSFDLIVNQRILK